MTRVILRISRTDHREWRWKTVQPTEQPNTNKSSEQPAPVKRKLPTNSPQIQHKKTKDTKTAQDVQTTDITVINKEPKPTETGAAEGVQDWSDHLKRTSI